MSSDPSAERIHINAMRAPDGSRFYPDSEDDARWFADEHGAVPVYDGLFPFSIAEPVIRARVTFTVDVLAEQPLELTAEALWAWVADKFGRVCDASPHRFEVTAPGGPERWQKVELGTLHDGPVEWVGHAPSADWHCGECRVPRRPDAGPCQRLVPFGGREYPCGIDDADHHGPCRFRPGGVA